LALAACGSPQAAAPAATSKPAAPTTAPAAGQAAPTTAAATAAPAAAAPAAASGVFNIWFNANWNEVTDKAIGDVFVEWGNQNGLKVEWQSIPGSPDVLAKQSAAVAAGKPPEIQNANLTYWFGQGEMSDLSEIVNKFKDKAGGIYEIGINSLKVDSGALIGAAYAIDVWPAHWRMDTIGAVTGGRFFDTWEELIELGPKVEQPPKTYAFAMAMGHEGDTVNNLCSALWGHGGRIATEKGVPDISNPANKAGIDALHVRHHRAYQWRHSQFRPARRLHLFLQRRAARTAGIDRRHRVGWYAVLDDELSRRHAGDQPRVVRSG
jgi:hypothetical protein